MGFLIWGTWRYDFQVPAVQSLDNDVLLLVIPNSHYGDGVPIVLGMLHIDMLLNVASEAELEALGKSWQWGSWLLKLLWSRHNCLQI